MNDRLIRAAANENGAASVLVILMMLVLVTLGTFAISSANFNYKLNRRTLEWNQMFYELDGRGEEFLAALDKKLKRAEDAALEYAATGGYDEPGHAELPPQAQSAIYEGYKAGELSRNEIVRKVYMQYADIFVKEMSLDFPETQLYTSDDGTFTDYIYIEESIKSNRSGSELSSLNIAVSVEPAEFSDGEGGVPVSRADGGKRYRIEEWYEYQEPLSEDAPTEELWDGSIDF